MANSFLRLINKGIITYQFYKIIKLQGAQRVAWFTIHLRRHAFTQEIRSARNANRRGIRLPSQPVEQRRSTRQIDFLSCIFTLNFKYFVIRNPVPSTKRFTSVVHLLVLSLKCIFVIFDINYRFIIYIMKATFRPLLNNKKRMKPQSYR